MRENVKDNLLGFLRDVKSILRFGGNNKLAFSFLSIRVYILHKNVIVIIYTNTWFKF